MVLPANDCLKVMVSPEDAIATALVKLQQLCTTVQPQIPEIKVVSTQMVFAQMLGANQPKKRKELITT